MECRWVSAVMEVGERSNGVRTDILCRGESREERRDEMIFFGGVKTDDMRVERRGDKN